MNLDHTRVLLPQYGRTAQKLLLGGAPLLAYRLQVLALARLPLLLLLIIVHCCCWPCAGEEQAKVEVLSSRLEELGEDVDKLLDAVAAAADEEQDDEEGGVHQEDGELL